MTHYQHPVEACKHRRILGFGLFEDVSLLDTVLKAEPRSFLWELLSSVLKPKSLTSWLWKHFDCQPSRWTSGLGSIVVFLLLQLLSVTYNLTLRMKTTDGLPCLREVRMGSIRDCKLVCPHLNCVETGNGLGVSENALPFILANIRLWKRGRFSGVFYSQHLPPI